MPYTDQLLSFSNVWRMISIALLLSLLWEWKLLRKVLLFLLPNRLLTAGLTLSALQTIVLDRFTPTLGSKLPIWEAFDGRVKFQLPLLDQYPLYSSRSNESVDFCSSLSATYIALLRGRFYPLKEHLNSRSWYGLCFPPWMNRLDSFLFFRHLCTSLGKSFETSCPRR